MSLGDAFQADVDQALDFRAKLAPEPEKPKGRGLWRTAFDSLAGAGAKAQASMLEVGRVVGPALTLSADPSNAEALDLVKKAPDFRENEQSKPFRDYERALRPDPVTAGEAEKIVYGFVGPMASLVGGAVVGGIPGLASVAAETGFSQSEDLAQQGVDIKTRTAIGGLTTVVTAGSALLPMAGSTVPKTIALYALGGPGQFVAQQAATREILKAADYNEIAKQYDPFDPAGLALSALVPAPFAAWGIRGNLKAGKVAKPVAEPVAQPEAKATAEQVDAAMAHNLTLQRDVHEATPPAKVAAEVLRGPVTENSNFKAWHADSKVVDGDGRPLVVFHGTAGEFDSFNLNRAGSAIDSGKLGEGFYFSQDPRWAGRYAENAASRADGAPSVMPVYLQMRNPLVLDGPGNVWSKLQAISEQWGIRLPPAIGEGMAPNPEWSKAFSAEAQARGHDGVVLPSTIGQAEYMVFRPEQIKSAIGNSGLFDPESPSLTDPMPAAPVRQKAEPETVTKAKQAAEQMQASGLKLEDFTASAKLPPDVQNLLIGLSEAGKDLDRAARLLDDFARTSEMQPGRSPTDIAADVVEAAREGRTVTPEPAKPAPATPEKATAESVSNRLQELEATAPDMVVRISDDGKPVTLADEMARIRREAAEGTDTELGSNDAGLLKVAADCALSTGA